MREDDHPERLQSRQAAVERVIRKLQPKGLDKDLRAEWRRVARLLAAPTVDRLKPHFVDVIVEYCHACARLRAYREHFKEQAEKAKTSPIMAELIRTEGGRYGRQVKQHPFVGQVHETWRQWRSLVAMLGLSPTDERNLLPGQGDLFDDAEQYF